MEEQRHPHLAGQPLGVTQKYLVVTCNYAARAFGVTKLQRIEEARAKCPGLHLIPGEDLAPYRDASRRILAVLQRFGPTERLGLDESYVDVTEEVRRRQALGRTEEEFSGHVFTCAAYQLRQDSEHRPMVGSSTSHPTYREKAAERLPG